MARSPCGFIISLYSMSSLQDLQKTVTAQRELINVLACNRNWLEGENKIKSANLIRLNQTIKEYEKYLQQREAAMALELEKQRGIQKEQNEKNNHWKNKYYIKKEECKSLKKDLNFGGAGQPAEETEVIKATVTEDMGLGRTLPTPEVAAVSAISTSESLVKFDFTPYDREQPLKEIEVSSGKKKVRIKYIV